MVRALPWACIAAMRATSAAVRAGRVSRVARRAVDSLRRVVLARRRMERGGRRTRPSVGRGRRERRTRRRVAPWATGVRKGMDSATPAS